MDINVTFCRTLLSRAHELVKKADSSINVRKDAWVYHFSRDHWEFHGPNKFYWHGSADNAYDARYRGWMSWLEKNHPDVVNEDDKEDEAA